jgi:FMN phosphatase YigB (HAD superfamily)
MSRPANQSELRALLSSHGVDTSQWGAGSNKTLNQLWEEIESGETELVASKQALIRKVKVVSIDVRFMDDSTGSLKKSRLFETKQEFSDGRQRERNRWGVREKMKPGEEVLDAVRRALQEELGIELSEDVAGRLITVGQTIVVKESRSYSGLQSQFEIHQFVIHLNSEEFSHEGYVERQEDKSTFFEWREQPPLRFICFDIGGVLLHRDREASLSLARKRWPEMTLKHLRRMQKARTGDGIDHWRAFQNGKMSEDEYLTKALGKRNIQPDESNRGHLKECLLTMYGVLDEPMVRLLRELLGNSDIRVSVLTNNNTILLPLAADACAGVPVLVSSHEIGVSKPNLEAFKSLMRSMDADLAEQGLQDAFPAATENAGAWMMIDDSARNIETAEQLGMNVFQPHAEGAHENHHLLRELLRREGVTSV